MVCWRVGGWVGEWVGGWVGGWMGGWVGGGGGGGAGAGACMKNSSSVNRPSASARATVTPVAFAAWIWYVLNCTAQIIAIKDRRA